MGVGSGDGCWLGCALGVGLGCPGVGDGCVTGLGFGPGLDAGPVPPDPPAVFEPEVPPWLVPPDETVPDPPGFREVPASVLEEGEGDATFDTSPAVTPAEALAEGDAFGLALGPVPGVGCVVLASAFDVDP